MDGDTAQRQLIASLETLERGLAWQPDHERQHYSADNLSAQNLLPVIRHRSRITSSLSDREVRASRGSAQHRTSRKPSRDRRNSTDLASTNGRSKWPVVVAIMCLIACAGGLIALWPNNDQHLPAALAQLFSGKDRNTGSQKLETAERPAEAGGYSSTVSYGSAAGADKRGDSNASHSRLAVEIRARTKATVFRYQPIYVDRLVDAEPSADLIRLIDVPTDAVISQGLNAKPGVWLLAKSQLRNTVIWLARPVTAPITIKAELLNDNGDVLFHMTQDVVPAQEGIKQASIESPN